MVNPGSIASFVGGLVGPVAVRAMMALGFTAVTFTGVTEGVNMLVTYAQTQWSSLPLAVIQLSSLSGIPESLGMVMGAYLARLSMWSIVSLSRYIKLPS